MMCLLCLDYLCFVGGCDGLMYPSCKESRKVALEMRRLRGGDVKRSTSPALHSLWCRYQMNGSGPFNLLKGPSQPQRSRIKLE